MITIQQENEGISKRHLWPIGEFVHSRTERIWKSVHLVRSIQQDIIFTIPLARPTRSHVKTSKKEHMQTLLKIEILVPLPEKYSITNYESSIIFPQTERNGSKWDAMYQIQSLCCNTCSSSSELLLFSYESQSSYQLLLLIPNVWVVQNLLILNKNG